MNEVLGLTATQFGFFPGLVLYLTYWFPARHRARATALFMLAIPLSNVVGAPLSSWLIDCGDVILGSFAGWRFMFFVEGLSAVTLGVMCLFLLTDRPRDAAWLKPEERAWLTDRMEAEEMATVNAYHYPVRQALLQPRVWALSFVHFGAVYGLYALSFFLPTIIAGFSERFGTEYTIVQIGLITAIPYSFGAVAICATLPCFWPLPQTFLAGAAAAAGIALVNSLGNSAGFFAPYITGGLAELTGTQNAGLWVVGLTMIAAGFVTLALKAAPKPDGDTVQ